MCCTSAPSRIATTASKSKRNRNGNVGARYVPIHAQLMKRLKEYVERKELKEGDLLSPTAKAEWRGTNWR
jgi:hypothetical protein